MNSEAMLNIISALKRAGHDELTKEESKRGLCHMIDYTRPHCAEASRVAQDLMSTWPERSRSKLYPVPSKTRPPKTAYIRGQAEYALYDGEYGQARKRLALFLADELESYVSCL